MLLEAYYMSLDSTWNKLTDMSELLDDAEVSCSPFLGRMPLQQGLTIKQMAHKLS